MKTEEPKQKVICTNDICQGECVECNSMTIVNVEKPKQETLEEFAKIKYGNGYGAIDSINAFIDGAKWQVERMFIDDEFLEWFVKNPSCEYIKTESLNIGDGKIGYVICKPKKEPKKEYKLNSCDIIFETASLIDT